MNHKAFSWTQGRSRGKKRQLTGNSSGTQLLKYGLAVLIVIFLGAAFEYFCHVPVLQQDSREEVPISLDTAAAEGFAWTEEGFLLTEEKGTLSIPLNGAYVEQFAYYFNYDHLLNAKVYVCYYNEYGEADPDQDLLIEDRNNKLAEASYLTIRKNVESIVLSVEKSDLGEPGTREEAGKIPLLITGFSICNELAVNWYRLAFFWLVFGLLAFFWLFRGYLGNHIEVGFLAVCFSVGMLSIFSFPANKIGFDEETHLYRAMGIASYPHGMNVDQTVFSLMVPNLDAWPENQPGSIKEQAALRSYRNEYGDYKTGTIHLEPVIPKGTIPAYLGQAVILKICKGFQIPWGTMLMLGRLGNLFVYGALMYFAIKTAPVGKVIMTVIGLMPTSMFLACTYSYDSWVTGWIYLGSACLLKEILTPEQEITWKSYLWILFCFLLGSSAKAVYAPMVLIALLLPASKFKNKNQRYVMAAGIFLAFAGLLSSFVIPVLVAPKETGDIRGGATSEAGQMSYILGHFIGYLKLLFQNIFRTMPKMLFGREIFSVQGHLADSPFTWFAMGLAGYAVVTDTSITTTRALNGLQKLWIFLMLGACALLIWTSMYIAYTVPGQRIIAGVQGRYYLPILYLFYLLFNSRMVVARFKNMWYHTGILTASAWLLLATMWVTVLVPMCM